MNPHLANVTLALLSTVFLLGCQEQPVGPDGQEPEFAHKNGKQHGGGAGGGGGKGGGKGGGGEGAHHPTTVSLANAMATTSPIDMAGKQIDLHADNNNFVQTITMDFQSAHTLAGAQACRVVAGAGGKADAEIEGIYWDLLQAQLTATVTRGSFYLDVDETGLAPGGVGTTTATHLLNVEFERAEDGFLTSIRFGFLAGDATVRWISSIGSVDVFEFSGPVMVLAHRVDGRKSRKSGRAMACDGTNKVTVTVDWSPGG